MNAAESITWGQIALAGVGVLMVLVGELVRRLLKRIEGDIGEVKANTADLPAVREQMKTLGREMGERKTWERDHDRLHLDAARAHGNGD